MPTLLVHEVTETLVKALKGFLTINTVLMSLVFGGFRMSWTWMSWT